MLDLPVRGTGIIFTLEKLFNRFPYNIDSYILTKEAAIP